LFKKLLVSISITLCIMLSFGQVALANDTEMSKGAKLEGIYSFDEDSNISLVEETVTYNIRSYESKGSKADVIVQYQLKNLTNEIKNVRMFYIISLLSEIDKPEFHDSSKLNISDVLKVSFNGKDITENCIYREEAEMPDNWIPDYHHKMPYPIPEDKNFRYDVQNTYYKRAEGIEIPFTLREFEEGNLEIQYSSTSGYDQEGYYKALTGYIFYLTPAKFLTGDSKLNLCVNFPQVGIYQFYSNIPMTKVSKNSYMISIDKLPSYEWSFSFFKKSAISFGTNNNILHTIYTFLTALAFFIIMIIISVKLKKRWMKEAIRPLAYIISFLFFNLNTNVTYSGSIGYAIFLLITAIFIPFIYLIRSIFRIRKFINRKV